jgi:hypothetical protein
MMDMVVEARPGRTLRSSEMERVSTLIDRRALALIQRDPCCMDGSYRSSHALLLRNHPSPEAAIGELFLFRLWLIQHVCHAPVWPAWSSDDRAIALAAAAHGRYLIAQAEGVDVELALEAALPFLLDSRFPLYGRFCTLGRQASDPHGLRAAALALSYQLFEAPTAYIRTHVRWLVEQQFHQLTHAPLVEGENPRP